MKKTRTIFITLSLLLLRLFAPAQQDALYNEYMFNHFVINPAYSGVKDVLNLTAFHRSQWVGFSGAPQTQSFSAYSPFGSSGKVGGGLQVMNDRLGALTTLGAFGSGSYKIRAAQGKLSFGLRGGVFNYTINRDKLDYKEKNDPNSLEFYNSRLVPAFDFGMYYYADNYFISLSCNHLSENKLVNQDVLNAINLKRHYFGMIGYSRIINDDVILKPFVMVKYVKNAPVNVDLNVSFLIKEKFTFGVAYRTSRSVVFNTAFYLNESLKFGYAFDYVLTDMRSNAKYGSHEIFLSYELKRAKKLARVINPRY